MLTPNGINNGLFIHYWPPFSVGVVLAYLHRYGVWSNCFLKNKVPQFIATLAAIGLLINTVTWFGKNGIFFAVSFEMFLWVISDIEKVMNKIKPKVHHFLKCCLFRSFK